MKLLNFVTVKQAIMIILNGVSVTDRLGMFFFLKGR